MRPTALRLLLLGSLALSGCKIVDPDLQAFGCGAEGVCPGSLVCCSYAPIDTPCNTPPSPTCVGGNARSYASTGTCNPGQGTCTYAPVDTTCSFGCSGGVCAGDPCAGVSCNSPPASLCDNASTLRIYSSPGSCSAGSCNYNSTTSNCPNGCANGACRPCNSTSCAAGCCLNGNCLLHEDYCRGTGGGSCGTACIGSCAGGCGFRSCQSGTCICEPLLVSRPDSVVAEPICPQPPAR